MGAMHVARAILIEGYQIEDNGTKNNRHIKIFGKNSARNPLNSIKRMVTPQNFYNLRRYTTFAPDPTNNGHLKIHKNP